MWSILCHHLFNSGWSKFQWKLNVRCPIFAYANPNIANKDADSWTPLLNRISSHFFTLITWIKHKEHATLASSGFTFYLHLKAGNQSFNFHQFGHHCIFIICFMLLEQFAHNKCLCFMLTNALGHAYVWLQKVLMAITKCSANGQCKWAVQIGDANGKRVKTAQENRANVWMHKVFRSVLLGVSGESLLASLRSSRFPNISSSWQGIINRNKTPGDGWQGDMDRVGDTGGPCTAMSQNTHLKPQFPCT